MGLRSAGNACQKAIDIVRYICGRNGVMVVNYLDDIGGAEVPHYAQDAFRYVGHLLSALGLDESHSKACEPAVRMTFLGILFNTVSMVMEVMPQRLQEISNEVEIWLGWWSSRPVSKSYRCCWESYTLLQNVCARAVYLCLGCWTHWEISVVMREWPYRRRRGRTLDGFTLICMNTMVCHWYQRPLGVNLMRDWPLNYSVASLSSGLLQESDACLVGCGGCVGMNISMLTFQSRHMRRPNTSQPWKCWL